MSEERQLRDRLETLQARRREQEALVAQGLDGLALQQDFERRTAELSDARGRLEAERDRLEQELAQAAEANARAAQQQEAVAPARRLAAMSGLFVGLAAVGAAWMAGSDAGAPAQALIAAAPAAVAAVLSFVRWRGTARGLK